VRDGCGVHLSVAVGEARRGAVPLSPLLHGVLFN
jgi:hypothetical protein